MLGGVDVTGPHLFTIHPHGSTDKLPYVSMGEKERILITFYQLLLIILNFVTGSGSLAAMATFEDRFKPDMTVSWFIDLALIFPRPSQLLCIILTLKTGMAWG